ncbi:MAG: ROK family protein [Solobacterium sp.]|nr:ROK family protein [Solobacterium sp.]
MKVMIGVDLGGTNIRVAKVDENGKILQEIKSPSYAQESRERVVENMKDLIHRIDGYDTCEGIGIGVPGPVNQVERKMTLSTNLPGFEGYPLAEEIEKEFHIPVYLENDADVAGLAEAMVGAGKDYPIVFYTTLSTGIGGGLIVNKQVVSGRKGFGAEIANIIIDRNRKAINKLSAGAVENEASGTNITRKANELMGEKVFKHAGEVFNAAERGNEDIQKLVEEATMDLAMMYATITATVAPDIFVLGGGMMQSKDSFLPKVIEKYQGLVHEQLRDTPFVEAKLAEPGVVGAAMLVLSRQK